jgi:hypothetical protein
MGSLEGEGGVQGVPGLGLTVREEQHRAGGAGALWPGHVRRKKREGREKERGWCSSRVCKREGRNAGVGLPKVEQGREREE